MIPSVTPTDVLVGALASLFLATLVVIYFAVVSKLGVIQVAFFHRSLGAKTHERESPVKDRNSTGEEAGTSGDEPEQDECTEDDGVGRHIYDYWA